MNINFNLKCEICGNIVRLKLSAGYVANNYFVYSCPECSVTIGGHVILDIETGRGAKEYKINNAVEVLINETQGLESHLLQLSTEYFTYKIKKNNYNGDTSTLIAKDPSMFISPFMLDRASSEVKSKKINLLRFTSDNFDEDSVISLRLWDLYKNGNYKYLKRELLKHDFVKPVTLGKVLNVNYQEKTIKAIYKPFLPFLAEGGFYKEIAGYKKQLIRLREKFPNEIAQLKGDLTSLIKNSDENIIHLS